MKFRHLDNRATMIELLSPWTRQFTSFFGDGALHNILDYISYIVQGSPTRT